MKYYRITMICAHMGNGYTHRTINFYFKASSIMKAISMAKRMPGVKHSRMPLSSLEISKEEYEEGRKTSAYETALCK